jgi:hypothetical protein
MTSLSRGGLICNIGALIVALERLIVDLMGLTTLQGSYIILSGLAIFVIGLFTIAMDRFAWELSLLGG